MIGFEKKKNVMTHFCIISSSIGCILAFEGYLLGVFTMRVFFP